jgi:hypothetical protein
MSRRVSLPSSAKTFAALVLLIAIATLYRLQFKKATMFLVLLWDSASVIKTASR